MNNTINPGNRLRSNLGLGVQGIEIYLPIRKDLVLAHTCPSIAVAYSGVEQDARRMGFTHAYAGPYLHALEHGSPIVMGKEHIQFQNSLQLGYAERFLYSSVDNFEDARKMLSENPRLKAGHRYGHGGTASGAS